MIRTQQIVIANPTVKRVNAVMAVSLMAKSTDTEVKVARQLEIRNRIVEGVSRGLVSNIVENEAVDC